MLCSGAYIQDAYIGSWGDLIEYNAGDWRHGARGNSFPHGALGNETESTKDEEVTSPVKKKGAHVDLVASKNWIKLQLLPPTVLPNGTAIGVEASNSKHTGRGGR